MYPSMKPNMRLMCKFRDGDYIQIPYNVFDQRMERTRIFNIARANGVTVFAPALSCRVIFMEGDDIPAHLKERGYICMI